MVDILQWVSNEIVLDNYLAPEGFARYCFHPVCMSVCLSVCLSVCVSGQYFGILYIGYYERYRYEIYTGY